jgi:DNA replication protein DnaC
MLTHPTIDKLKKLKFAGMVKALEEQMSISDIDSLSFDERLVLLIDREMTTRENRRLDTRLRKAKLRQNVSVEDIDYHHPRGLDKSLILKLSDCNWIREHNNLTITGPTGTGKTFLACAIAQKACREGYSTQYLRLNRLFQDLVIAKGDGRYSKLLSSFAKTDLLLFDDFGIAILNQDQSRDILEILDDRHGIRSTIFTSQFPIEKWHDLIGDPTLADAIMDRLVHNAYKIKLKGDSMRKKNSRLTNSAK